MNKNKIGKCGYVAIIGRPNVGKSTLLNCILQKKISIVSPKPQTTRCQILGIKTEGDIQTIYIDTPGLHHAEKRAMNRYMNRLASSVILDADVVVFMIEALHWREEDELVLNKLSDVKSPVILVVNKVDEVKDKNSLLPFIEKINNKYQFAHVIPLSARKSDNVNALETIITELLPAGPHLFPDEQITDKSETFQVAERIREKLIQSTEQELPYSTMVEIEEFKKEEKLIRISAIIWVERESQKPIVIGRNGELLKKIGTQARKEIEVLLGKKVFLRLWVKVKDNWTDNEQALQHIGH